MKISDEKLLELYQKEWEKTIDVQMHFNELIIKFRTAILSFFVTSLWIIIWYSKGTSLFLLSLPFWFLLISFLFDNFYYTKLLLAATKQSKKFDNIKKIKGIQFFWLTKKIWEQNKSKSLKKLLYILYLGPIVLYLLYLLHFICW